MGGCSEVGFASDEDAKKLGSLWLLGKLKPEEDAAEESEQQVGSEEPVPPKWWPPTADVLVWWWWWCLEDEDLNELRR